MDLGALDGTDGFAISGIDAGDFSGWSVSGAGDVNGDGVGDVIIGANGANSMAGESYVVFGKDVASNGGFAANVSLGSLTGADGFVINGFAAGDRAGSSVSNVGDLNGDGVDDVIVGAVTATPNLSLIHI